MHMDSTQEMGKPFQAWGSKDRPSNRKGPKQAEYPARCSVCGYHDAESEEQITTSADTCPQCGHQKEL